MPWNQSGNMQLRSSVDLFSVDIPGLGAGGMSVESSGTELGLADF